MKRFVLLTLLLLSACQTKTIKPQSQSQDANPVVITNRSGIQNGLISAKGIGKARLGMTIGELKAVVDPDTNFEIIPSFIENIDAIAVSENNIVQYYIVHIPEDISANTRTPTDKDKINLLITDNYHYQTKEGVKAGMSIEEAEEIYGDAVLAYNTDGESREYITFNDNNDENIKFRASFFKLISDGLGFSGIYPEYPGVSYTTDKYRPDSAIAAIEVSCNSQDCTE